MSIDKIVSDSTSTVKLTPKQRDALKRVFAYQDTAWSLTWNTVDMYDRRALRKLQALDLIDVRNYNNRVGLFVTAAGRAARHDGRWAARQAGGELMGHVPLSMPPIPADATPELKERIIREYRAYLVDAEQRSGTSLKTGLLFVAVLIMSLVLLLALLSLMAVTP